MFLIRVLREVVRCNGVVSFNRRLLAKKTYYCT